MQSLQSEVSAPFKTEENRLQDSCLDGINSLLISPPIANSHSSRVDIAQQQSTQMAALAGMDVDESGFVRNDDSTRGKHSEGVSSDSGEQTESTEDADGGEQEDNSDNYDYFLPAINFDDDNEWPCFDQEDADALIGYKERELDPEDKTYKDIKKMIEPLLGDPSGASSESSPSSQFSLSSSNALSASSLTSYAGASSRYNYYGYNHYGIAKLESITEITNSILAERFELYSRHVANRRGVTDNAELSEWLMKNTGRFFHGTQPHSVDAICRDGFSRTFAHQHGSYFRFSSIFYHRDSRCLYAPL